MTQQNAGIFNYQVRGPSFMALNALFYSDFIIYNQANTNNSSHCRNFGVGYSSKQSKNDQAWKTKFCGNPTEYHFTIK